MPDVWSQGTIAAGQCSQTLLVQRVQMMTEVPQIQFSDVRRQGREPTHQEECVIKQTPQTVSEQPVGGVGREQEEQSRQRDDQAVVRANVGERDRVKFYMSEALTKTRQQQGMEPSSDIVNTMTVSSDEANEIATVSNNPLQFKIPGYVLNRDKNTHDITCCYGQGIVQQREGPDG